MGCRHDTYVCYVYPNIREVGYLSVFSPLVKAFRCAACVKVDMLMNITFFTTNSTYIFEMSAECHHAISDLSLII